MGLLSFGNFLGLWLIVHSPVVNYSIFGGVWLCFQVLSESCKVCCGSAGFS